MNLRQTGGGKGGDAWRERRAMKPVRRAKERQRSGGGGASRQGPRETPTAGLLPAAQKAPADHGRSLEGVALGPKGESWIRAGSCLSFCAPSSMPGPYFLLRWTEACLITPIYKSAKTMRH